MKALRRDLESLRLDRYPAVLVHSSFKGLGPVDGGPADVVAALSEAAGDRTSILFPTLTYSSGDGPAAPPRMDVRSTPCRTGAIPEASRTAEGAVRSLHPTHSVTALGGPARQHWVAGHEDGHSPCDSASPYAMLIREGGAILLLGGVTHDSNTTLHCLEELAQVPYHLQSLPTTGVVIDVDGHEHVVTNRLHQWGWDRDFRVVDPVLTSADAQRRAMVGASPATLIAAAAMAEVLLPLLRSDPLRLLTPAARSRFERGEPPLV